MKLVLPLTDRPAPRPAGKDRNARPRAWLGAATLVLVHVTAACDASSPPPASDDGGSTPTSDAGSSIDPTTYDRTCAVDDDCVAVAGDDVCAPCPCPDDAIARRSLAAFESQRAERKRACPVREGIGCQPSCLPLVVHCNDARQCVFGSRDAGGR